MLQLHELEEFRRDAYESSRIYKEKAKTWHDSKIQKKELHVNQMVLLYNSRLKLFPRKLKSRWTGPYRITKILYQGAVELLNENSGNKFLVNGHRLKPYLAQYPGKQEQSTQALLLKNTN